MRSLFLILLFANLLVFASQFDVIRGLVGLPKPTVRPAQMNAEKLRIVRDTSAPPRPSADPAGAGSTEGQAQPPSGTNNR